MNRRLSPRLGFLSSRLLLALALGSAGVLLVVLSSAENRPLSEEMAGPTTASGSDSWSLVASPNTNNTDGNDLNGVACSSASECWAVGYAGGSLIERWNGTSWTIVSNPGSGVLSSVACGSDSQCWAVGHVGNSATGATYTLIEHWDGTSWSVVVSPNPDPTATSSTYNDLTSVTCTSNSDCWAVGYYDQWASGQWRTVAEHWDGTSWSIVPSANANAVNNFLYGVTCSSASQCWAVGYSYNFAPDQTLTERWDGASWSIVASPNSGSYENQLASVACSSDSDCWAVGNYFYLLDPVTSAGAERTLIEHWDGASWSTASSPNPAPNWTNRLRGVACATNSDCWAVGWYFDASNGNSINQTLIEGWDGTSWSIVSSPNSSASVDNDLNAVTCGPAVQCWSVGNHSDSTADRTLIERYVATLTPVIVGGNTSAIATLGEPFIFQIVATKSPTSYDAAGLPPGLTIDMSSGLVYGIPTTSGTFTVNLSATNSFGTGMATLMLTVQPVLSGPQIISSTSATGRVGKPFSFTVLTSNTTPFAKLSTSPLPDGLSLDPTGVISGTPTVFGNFPITLTLTDGAATTSAVLQLSFVSDPAIPVITSSDSGILTQGAFFSYTFTADANATFSYIGLDGVKNGALPAGLTFDGIATISGTYLGPSGPNRSGTVRINTKSTTSNIEPNTIKIRPPLICSVQLIATSNKGTTTAPLNFFAGPSNLSASQPPDITVEATGPIGEVVNFASPVVTDGSANNLSVTCVPSSGSTFPVGKTTVICTSVPDSSGAYAVVTFNVTVADTKAPVITAIPISITVAKAKTAKGQPQGATVNFANQLAAVDNIDGAVTPMANPPSGSFFPVGNTSVTVTATDHAGNTTTQTFTVNVVSKVPKGKAPTVSVSAGSTSINEGQSTTFTISVSAASPSRPLMINYSMGGSAVFGTDYTLSDQFGESLGASGSILIPSGAQTVTITLNAPTNSENKPSETAMLTIGSGSGYNLGKAKKGQPNLDQVSITINNVP